MMLLCQESTWRGEIVCNQVPVQITRSPSLTWLASISLTFLLPCS